MSYIRREALFHTVEEYASVHPVMNDNELFALFCTVPAAEVQEVKRGKWEDTLFGWLCTNCREEQQYAKRLRYCPNCGAKMDVQEVDT